MRLKSLEIKGFKSFANETVIHFNEAITGIVGPNGSGKSNVVDAIRWVLGEQKSAELRLDKMNSVIFNGTKKRKAAQMALVTLTFENTKNILPTDFANVSITRILYASGESEYRLNGVTCRLKDITNLFMDTGIGSNSYAIIALGMVDDILNDKQNSRRMMLEQAAGVSKYKARKHETMNKLSATEEDLNRVEDLLHEIDGNLKTLEKQAKRTQKYFDLKNEYKKYAVDLAILKLSVFKNDYVTFEKRIESETDNWSKLETQSLQLEAEIEKEKTNNITNEQKLSERQRDLNQLVGRIRQAENEKQLAMQQKSFVTQNQQRSEEQIAVNQRKINQLQEELTFLRDDITEEKHIEKTLEKQLEDAKQQLENVRNNHGNLKTGVDELLKQQQQIERELFELEKKKAIAQNQIENQRRDITQQQNDTQNRRKELAELTEKVAEQDHKIKEKQAELDLFEREEAERTQGLELAQQKIEESQQKLASESRALDAKRNEFRLTKSMIEKLEGFPESIQFLAKNKDWNAPLLSDIVFVTPQYRAAIENYLENYLNYYVVETLDEAAKAITLLSNSQKGKANFFILDEFRKHAPAVAPLANEPFSALSFIEVDAKYKPIFNYLLQNVTVSEDENLKTPSNTGGVLLSRSGSYIRRPFSISGGSVGLFEGNKIGRKKNLEILEQEIKTAERIVEQLQQELTSIKEQVKILKTNDKTLVIRQTKDVLNLFVNNKSIFQTKFENFTAFVKEADERETNAENNIKNLQNDIVETEAKLREQTVALAAAKMNATQADASYRDVADRMSHFSQQYNEQNVAFIRQQNKVSTFQRDIAFKERQLDEAKAILKQAQNTVANIKDELNAAQTDINRLQRDLEENYERRKIAQGNLNDFEQSFYKNRNHINEQETLLRDVNRKRNEVQSLVNQLKDKFNDIKLKISSIGERLQVEFNISVNDAMNQTVSQDIGDPEELDKKVTSWKRQLDTFGEVNPMAVEAFNEMKERFDNISTQRNDIVAAKTSLMETMKEIETLATEQFMTAFETIRTSFREVFKSLFFEEDDADIVLIDPTKPLESGINIIAKPKGKRPQSIAQLSGGEKTLTATALLFALYLYKPAPFCIFDEVDAPLDDANIEKFNKIIEKFSKSSQFIIVTHNKATMAAVDVIYGVHMPEQGVSAVTPVDFRSFGHTQTFEAIQN
jgi:chromosome segregation protein